MIISLASAVTSSSEATINSTHALINELALKWTLFSSMMSITAGLALNHTIRNTYNHIPCSPLQTLSVKPINLKLHLLGFRGGSHKGEYGTLTKDTLLHKHRLQSGLSLVYTPTLVCTLHTSVHHYAYMFSSAGLLVVLF